MRQTLLGVPNYRQHPARNGGVVPVPGKEERGLQLSDIWHFSRKAYLSLWGVPNSVCLPACLSVSLSRLSVCLYVSLSVRQSLCLSVFL